MTYLKYRISTITLLSLCAFALMACNDFDEYATTDQLATEPEITEYLTDMSFSNSKNGLELHFGSDGNVQVFDLEKDLPLYIGKWRTGISTYKDMAGNHFSKVFFEGTHYCLREGKLYSGSSGCGKNFNLHNRSFLIRSDGVAELRIALTFSESAIVLENPRKGFPQRARFNLVRKNVMEVNIIEPCPDKSTGLGVVGGIVGGILLLGLCLETMMLCPL